MQRGRLFFIGLVSAIITIISLNVALGSRWSGYNHHYRGYCHYTDRYNGENDQQKKHEADTSNSKY